MDADDDLSAVRRRIAALERQVQYQLDELGSRGLYEAAANVLQAARARPREPETAARLEHLAERAEAEADLRLKR